MYLQNNFYFSILVLFIIYWIAELFIGFALENSTCLCMEPSKHLHVQSKVVTIPIWEMRLREVK